MAMLGHVLTQLRVDARAGECPFRTKPDRGIRCKSAESFVCRLFGPR